ncbi:hypothetical protein DOP60_RS26830, partial [Escherichia coli]
FIYKFIDFIFNAPFDRDVNIYGGLLAKKYLESRSQKIKKPAGEAGSFIYYSDANLLIVQHFVPTNKL